MKIVNEAVAEPKSSVQAKRTALVDYMAGKPSASFDDARKAVAALKGLKDGELHQLAIDAGFKVQL